MGAVWSPQFNCITPSKIKRVIFKFAVKTVLLWKLNFIFLNLLQNTRMTQLIMIITLKNLYTKINSFYHILCLSLSIIYRLFGSFKFFFIIPEFSLWFKLYFSYLTGYFDVKYLKKLFHLHFLSNWENFPSESRITSIHGSTMHNISIQRLYTISNINIFLFTISHKNKTNKVNVNLPLSKMKKKKMLRELKYVFSIYFQYIHILE